MATCKLKIQTKQKKLFYDDVITDKHKEEQRFGEKKHTFL